MKAALYVYISEKISQHRRQKGIKQIEIAKAVGINRTTMSNIEAGRQLVMLEMLYKICEVLEVEPKEMIPPMEWYFDNKDKIAKREVKTVFEFKISADNKVGE